MAYSTIDKPTDNFNTILYTGTGSTHNVTGVGFAPDWVWIKIRSGGSHNTTFDTVRGAGQSLNTDDQRAEHTVSGHLTAFGSDGFTLGDNTGNGNTNQASATFVAWNWLAGGTAPTQTYTVKVVSDSGNKYRFDDFGTSAVTLNLQEGGTYTFDQSDSSNSGHPLRFSTTSDGTHGGGSEYTTGVTTTGTPGSAGAKTVITLGTGVANLYYYCTQHSGMGGLVSTNTTNGSSNFSGSIQSTVSANTTAGFSIVAYTGTTGGASSTIGHGLGQTPDVVILKPRSYDGAWWWAQKGRSNKVLELQTNNAEVDPSSSFGGGGLKYSTFTNSVFGGTDGTSNDDLWNTNGATYIAYCFKSIKGYSKIFEYTGNGTGSPGAFDNGTFIHLGFKPSYIVVKRADGSDNWTVWDNKRESINPNNNVLFPSTNSAESTSDASYQCDFLSNGIKWKGNSTGMNTSGAKYIGLAFAENPFVTSTGIPTTAK